MLAFSALPSHVYVYARTTSLYAGTTSLLLVLPLCCSYYLFVARTTSLLLVLPVCMRELPLCMLELPLYP